MESPKLSCLIGDADALCPDILCHHGDHARRHHMKHNDKHIDVGICRTDRADRVVPHRGEHDGIDHARQHVAQRFQRYRYIEFCK